MTVGWECVANGYALATYPVVAERITRPPRVDWSRIDWLQERDRVRTPLPSKAALLGWTQPLSPACEGAAQAPASHPKSPVTNRDNRE